MLRQTGVPSCASAVAEAAERQRGAERLPHRQHREDLPID